MGALFPSYRAAGQQIPMGIQLFLLSLSATVWAALSPGRQCHSRTVSMVTKQMDTLSFSSHANQISSSAPAKSLDVP